MTIKPENQFITGVHKYVAPAVYRMKNNNAYTAGVPDVWYSGHKADVWVEYKFVQKLPTRDNTIIIPGLTPLQLEWLSARYNEGRTVLVVIGCKQGGVLLHEPAQWREGLSKAAFERNTISRKEIAERITQLCL